MAKSLIIRITEKCNSECRMCSVRATKDGDLSHQALETVKETLEENQGDYDRIDLTGGEPTVHEDLPEIIEFAKQLGYTVSMNTNGRKLEDTEYTKKLIEKGLDEANVSLHSFDSESSREITGYEENFGQTVKGLENLLENGVNVNMVTACMASNLEHMEEIAQIGLEKNVDRWNITRLLPSTPAGGYKRLAAPPSKTLEKLRDMKDIFEKFPNIGFYKFTKCELPSYIRDNYRVVTLYSHLEDWDFEQYQEERGMGGREKEEICERCPYSEKCLGFWEKDLDLFPEETISNARQNLDLS